MATISVVCGTSSLATSTTVGVEAVDEWNVVTSADLPASNLNDDTGSATTCDFAITGLGGTDSDTRASDDSSDEFDIFDTGFRAAASGQIDVELTQIPYSDYDLIVYLDERSGSVTGDDCIITDGTTTFYAVANEASQWAGSFVQITSESSGSPDTVGNYVRFTGLSAASVTVVLTDTARWCVCGFQIVENAGGSSVSGTPSLPAVTADGALGVQRNVSGTPSLPAATATGTLGVERNISGTPSLPAVTATGAIEVQRNISGTPSLPAITGDGALSIAAPVDFSGTPSLPAVTGDGALSVQRDVSGTPSLPAVTSTGAIAVQKDLAGTPSLPAITATGNIFFGENSVSGTPSLPAITATGSIGVVRNLSGTPSLPAFIANGAMSNATERTGTAAGTSTVTGGARSTKTNTGSKLNRYGNMPIGYIVGDKVYPVPGFERWLAELLDRTGGVDVE